MGYLSRQPTSNDPPRKSPRYGPQEPDDDFSALLNEKAARCRGICKRVILKQHLVNGECPDCRCID